MVVNIVGLSHIVLGHGGVVVLASWVVVAALVFWSYTGALISLLAVRHIPQPIQTLRDLLDDHTVTLIMLPMTVFTDTASVSFFMVREARNMHLMMDVSVSFNSLLELCFFGSLRGLKTYVPRYSIF